MGVRLRVDERLQTEPQQLPHHLPGIRTPQHLQQAR
jgi:hypothetical protein